MTGPHMKAPERIPWRQLSRRQRARRRRALLGDSKAVKRWWHSVPHTHRHLTIPRLLMMFPLYRRFETGWHRINPERGVDMSEPATETEAPA